LPYFGEFEMSEMGEYFSVMRDLKKEKRAANTMSSTELIKSAGVAFESNNSGAHLVVTCCHGVTDFWPSTGLWIVRGQKKKHRGVVKLIQWAKEQSK
jgi:hypothetical protein